VLSSPELQKIRWPNGGVGGDDDDGYMGTDTSICSLSQLAYDFMDIAHGSGVWRLWLSSFDFGLLVTFSSFSRL